MEYACVKVFIEQGKPIFYIVWISQNFLKFPTSKHEFQFSFFVESRTNYAQECFILRFRKKLDKNVFYNLF